MFIINQYLLKIIQMASKTIKIWPIDENCNEEDIKNALGTSEINRILIKKSAAYVELESQDAVEVLEFTNPYGKFEQLNDAKFQKVDSNFTWDSLSSDSSEIQELKEQRDNFQKGEEHTVHLTQPSPQNIFTINNCDLTVISSLNQQSIKKNVFGSFTSIGRVLKKGDKIIFQLENQYESEKFQAVFPNLKIPALGNNAAIDLDAENQRNFAEEWIKQHNTENEIRSARKQEEQDKTKGVLHEEIIPKLNKLTSMQTNFLNSQQSSGSKVQQGFQDIAEHSSENVHTKNQLPENSQSFVLSEERPEREDIMIGDVSYQQERRKTEEQERRENQRRENQRRENQRRENEKRLRQQADRRKQQQQNKRRHQEEENRKRQQQQQTTKRQQQQQARKRQQQQQARRIQQQEQARKRQQQEQTRKKQQQQQERIKKQEQDDRKRSLEEAQRLLQSLEKQQRQAAAQMQRQHQLRQQKQREMLRIKQSVQKQELEKKKLQEQIRIQREREQEERKRKSQIKKVTEQFVLPQNIGQRAQQSIQDFIGKASPERISQFINKDSRTPAYFWGLVMLVVFILLVI